MTTKVQTCQSTDISTFGYPDHYGTAALDLLGIITTDRLKGHEHGPTSRYTPRMYQGGTIHAHKVPQALAIEYYIPPEDSEFSVDISPEVLPLPPSYEIECAVRDISVSLYFRTFYARVRGEETLPLWTSTDPVRFGLQFSPKNSAIGRSPASVRVAIDQWQRVAAKGRDKAIASLCESLEAFKDLEQGWDSYSAPIPSRIAIENAKVLIKEAEKLDTTPERVEPSAMGGVGVTFASSHREVVVEFYNKGTAHALFSDDETGEMHTQAIPTNLDGYRRVIREVRKYLYGK